MITAIAFDGDDTLWHNETIFSVTQGKFRDLLRDYVDETEITERLVAVERRNLALFGYGIKGFTLSMIETAIEVSGGRVTSAEIQRLIDYGKSMLSHPVELLDGVRPVVEALRDDYRLVLVTKGDLFDQESKLARSGLAELFWRIEIVSEKDEATYRRILGAHGIDPAEFLMVGNSVRSDILPVVAIGARAVHVPYHVTWVHEQVDLDEAARAGFFELESVAQLPGLLATIARPEAPV